MTTKPERLELWLRRHWFGVLCALTAWALAVAWWATHIDEVASLIRHWINVVNYLMQ